MSLAPARVRAVPAAIGGVALLLLSGCGSAAPAATPTSARPAGAGRSSSAAPGAPTATRTGSATATTSTVSTTGGGATPPSGFRWTPSPGSTAIQTATTDSGHVAYMWLDPARLRFRFVPGTQVPEGSPVSAADRRPSTWVPRMLAAFDSGYKLSDHVGGYYYLGRTVSPLRDGLASLVVHKDGTLAIGVWGSDLSMTPDTLVVRQNLPPIVLDGVARTSPSDGIRTWGIPTHNRPEQNRSALGRLADGSLVFVYAHNATPAGLAQALVAVGARMAIVLDMNLSWPTGFLYAHHGSQVVGTKLTHWATRSPSMYLTPFKKDFIVVEGA